MFFSGATTATDGVLVGRVVKFEDFLYEHLGHLVTNFSDVTNCVIFLQDEV